MSAVIAVGAVQFIAMGTLDLLEVVLALRVLGLGAGGAAFSAQRSVRGRVRRARGVRDAGARDRLAVGARALGLEQVAAGEVIIREGELGERFYLRAPTRLIGRPRS
jgi:hypothetical protein